MDKVIGVMNSPLGNGNEKYFFVIPCVSLCHNRELK